MFELTCEALDEIRLWYDKYGPLNLVGIQIWKFHIWPETLGSLCT